MSAVVAAAADLHIGVGAGYSDNRLADQEDILDQLVGCCRERDCDLLLLAGDIFHRPRPTPMELHVFARFAAKLEQAGIPAIAILGNAAHDQEATDRPTALELFESDWLRVSRRPEVLKAAGDVAVCTLPSVPVARLVAQMDGADRGAVDEIAADLLVASAAELRAQVPDGWPAVLLGHWAVSGSALPNGLPVADLHEPVLPLDALEAQGWDVIVLGHIHRPQVIEPSPFGASSPAFYCGSPMTHDFGEQDVEHGCWIVTLRESPTDALKNDLGRMPAQVGGDSLSVATLREPGALAGSSGGLDLAAATLSVSGNGTGTPGSLSVEFVPLADRRFLTIDVDLTSEESEDAFVRYAHDETDQIIGAVAARFLPEDPPLAGAVIRIRATMTEAQSRLVDWPRIRRFVMDAGAHRLYAIQPIIKHEQSVRAAGVDETLGKAEALDAWLSAGELGAAERDGLRLLLGEYLEVVA